MISTNLANRICVATGILAIIILAVLAFLPIPACGPAPSRGTPLALELARSQGDLNIVFGPDAGCASERAQDLNRQVLIASVVLIPAAGAFLLFFFLAMVPRDEYAAFVGFILCAVAIVAAYSVNACLLLIDGAPFAPGWPLTLLPFFAAIQWLALGLAGAVGGMILLKAGRANYPAALGGAAGLLGAVAAIANPRIFGALAGLTVLPMLAFLIVSARLVFATADDAVVGTAPE